ncbi:MAG: hypothetical protein GZ089_06830 [Aromatoleum sp.]|nr:hypothetical protein [Aromatoleum sp.]
MASGTMFFVAVGVALLVGGVAGVILSAVQSSSTPGKTECDASPCDIKVSFSWGGLGGLQVDLPLLVLTGLKHDDVDIRWHIRDGFVFKDGGVVFKFPDDVNAGQFDQMYPVDDHGNQVAESRTYHWRAKKGSVGTFLYNVTVHKSATGVAFGPLDPAIRNQGN